jgi:hypothetical protein
MISDNFLSQEMTIFMKSAFSLLFSATLLAASSATASISLVIDSASNKFWFTGSDTGILQFNGDDQYESVWYNGSTSGSESDASVSDSFSINSDSSFAGFELINDSGTSGIILMIFNHHLYPGDVTITADSSVKYDFSVLGGGDASYEPIFESCIGKTLQLNEGTDFTSIDVVGVPEPATYAGFAGIGALVLALIRRRAGRD